jgi:hypothetical protein
MYGGSFIIPMTGGVAVDKPKVGRAKEVIVECDMAIGPSSRDHWRRLAEGVKSRGVEVVTFEVQRFTVSEAELKKMIGG